MKKLIALLLILTLALGCAIVLNSCGKDDENEKEHEIDLTKPNLDPDKAEAALREGGFSVERIPEENLSAALEQGISGLTAAMFASTYDDGVYLFYFEDKATREANEEALRNAYAWIFEEAEEEGYDIIYGSYENVAWFGTEYAIAVSSGGVKPEETYIPSSDPDEAIAGLTAAGFEIERMDEDDISEELVDVEIIINAYKSKGEGMMLFYFQSEEAAKAARELIEEAFNEHKRSYEEDTGLTFPYTLESSGKMYWYGDASAIKAASGKGVPSDNVDDDGNDTNTGENLEVFFYFERVMEAFESAGFKISNFDYEELEEGDDYYYTANFQASYESQWIYVYFESSDDHSEIMYSGVEYAYEAFKGLFDNIGVNVELEFGVYANVGYVGDEKSIAFLKTLGDNILTDDKDAAREKLEREGYSVNYNEAIDNGIDVKITATAVGDPSNSLTIYYFEDEYYLLNHYKTILIQYNVYKQKYEEEGKEFNYLLGRSGLVVWIGTEEMIDVVS